MKAIIPETERVGASLKGADSAGFSQIRLPPCSHLNCPEREMTLSLQVFSCFRLEEVPEEISDLFAKKSRKPILIANLDQFASCS